MENDTELITITIDADLAAKVEEMIRLMGITQEQLIVRFFHWCVDEPEEAIAYLKKAQEEQGKELHHD
ncbi:ribbon-helix-helix protein, CopG family [Pseudoflavonifractor sp. CLA-AP-H29]|uniref:Ribbon-helix-helix protein, CopG family n=1 Tax=Pseudoflavonifractor intestinihominis TaxID=3133171 RepID=A0ABV1E811_9FIRM